MTIKENIVNIQYQLTSKITLVAATKKRTSQEIRQAIAAGITHIGENYVKEALNKNLQGLATLHLIGHLQTNKVKTAVQLFDIIETVDSQKLAKEIDKQCKTINKIMPILIEINSGNEKNKTGIPPEQATKLITIISKLNNIKIQGLMTMAPHNKDPEQSRPYFKATKKIFDEIKSLAINDVEMKTLSMGMSHSYTIAIEEGATQVRLGTAIFGER
ncbi:MAG: YggS family pyridoxal phosphate-dependent enzyme [Nanoarchaeota archaeon]|nr:YggS family pyridoxal phosphate-dependent enzyme [Nanoarchaeota archaeon]